MNSIEISINHTKYILKADESKDHLHEVADAVLRKIENLKKQKPDLSFQKAAILAALDFASLAIKGKKKSVAYQSNVLSKAHDVLSRVETELASGSNLQ